MHLPLVLGAVGPTGHWDWKDLGGDTEQGELSRMWRGEAGRRNEKTWWTKTCLLFHRGKKKTELNTCGFSSKRPFELGEPRVVCGDGGVTWAHLRVSQHALQSVDLDKVEACMLKLGQQTGSHDSSAENSVWLILCLTLSFFKFDALGLDTVFSLLGSITLSVVLYLVLFKRAWQHMNFQSVFQSTGEVSSVRGNKL